MKNVKLKDYQYQIKGTNSNKCLNQCLEAIILGLMFPLILATVIRLIDFLITGS